MVVEGPLAEEVEAPTLRGTEPSPTPSPEADAPEARVEETEAAAATTRLVVRGRVSDRTTKRDLEDAEVRGAVVDNDRALRFAIPGLQQARTGVDGRYELVFEFETLPADLVFTVLARGYQSPHARPEGEGEVYMDRTRLHVLEAGEAELDFALLPGLDIGGVVVDDEGVPIEGVEIVVTHEDEASTAYLEILETDRQGRFRIHDLLPPPAEEGRPEVRGCIEFTHPAHVSETIEDAYALSGAERASLEVVMVRGLALRGVLRHADGSPAGDHLVETFRGDANANRKCALTGADGTFVVKGIGVGEVVLRASSARELSFVERNWDVRANDEEVELQLERLPFRGPVERERALGLEFVAMPPEVKKTLGYPDAYALWITEVTEDAPEALRRWAQPGDVLWDVGGIDVTSLRDVVAGVLKSVDRYAFYDEKAGRPPREEYGVRIVIGIRRPGIAGTNTQGMKVTREQVEELRRWLAEHPEED